MSSLTLAGDPLWDRDGRVQPLDISVNGTRISAFLRWCDLFQGLAPLTANVVFETRQPGHRPVRNQSGSGHQRYVGTSSLPTVDGPCAFESGDHTRAVGTPRPLVGSGKWGDGLGRFHVVLLLLLPGIAVELLVRQLLLFGTTAETAFHVLLRNRAKALRRF